MSKKNHRERPGPGCEGKVELGERTISDPLEAGARYTAVINVRESAIAHMASRGRINASQEAAGERFRKLWEQARIGRGLSIDPAKEAVDGGKFSDPMSDELVRAGRDLARVIGMVGPVGAKLLIDIVGEGKLLERVAADWSRAGGVVSGRRAQGYITGRLVEALDELVRVWMLDGRGKADMAPAHYLRFGKRVEVIDDIVASGPVSITGPTREISVGRFGDTVAEFVRPVDRGPMSAHVAGNSQKRASRR